MWISSQIEEMKSVFSVSAHVFSLLKKWRFEEYLLAEDNTIEDLMISTLEKFQPVKNERV